MTAGAGRRERSPITSRDYRVAQILLWCLLLLGPAIVLHAIYADRRDQPSLQWPKISGSVVQSRIFYHPGRAAFSFHTVEVEYVYQVDGRVYSGNRVKLWDPDLHREDILTEPFVAAHPVGSTVDVYYDPQQPERAVLIPGADETGYRFYLWDGSLLTVFTIAAVFQSRKFFPRAIARAKAKEAARAAHPPAERIPGLPHAFVSYEPGSPRKLNCFPDKQCLHEVLGQKGKKLQDWQPEDRVIDTSGHEYRLVPSAERKSYELEPTGTKWTCEQLLDVAETDARLIKTDPATLRRQVEQVPADRKMAVLMNGIDDFATGRPWVVSGAELGFVLFLVLFFLVVGFVAWKLLSWLHTL